MRRDCGTENVAREFWLVTSPSAVCIPKQLFSSFAINVKLLDLFWIANAIFRFLKNFCLLVDCLVTYTANVSKVLKNIDEKLLSSLVLITSSLLVTKNFSATANIFSVIESAYCGKKAISKSHLGTNVRNPDIKKIKKFDKIFRNDSYLLISHTKTKI